jgi:hypothetical protein
MEVPFSCLDPEKTYRLVVSGRPPVQRKGRALSEQGYRLEP